MVTRNRPKQVYAVIRLDHFLQEDIPLPDRVIVKEIVSDLRIAESEVKRLNKLRDDKGHEYFWQATRLYPDGKSAGPDLHLELADEAGLQAWGGSDLVEDEQGE